MGDGRMTEMAEELAVYQAAERRRRGLPPEVEGLRIIPRRTDRRTARLHVERMLCRRYGEEGRRVIETNAEASAIHNCAVELLTDIFMGGTS